MTPEEQVTVINDPAFRDAIQGRVNDAIAALRSVNASAPEIVFVEQEIQVRVKIIGDGSTYLDLELGAGQNGTPIFDWRAPVRWFEHTATAGGA